MRKTVYLKTIIISMVVFLLFITGINCYAMEDVKGTEYEEAVTVLSALDIIHGYLDGTFRPQNKVTRAEFTAFACRIIYPSNPFKWFQCETPYSDVSDNHWASGFINALYNYGIDIGFEDGTFRPNNYITYGDTIRVIVDLLGYKPAAEAMGGYPSGYYNIAVQERILRDLQVVGIDIEVTRGDLCKLIFNACDVVLMEQTGFGENPIYEKNADGRTLLSDRFDVMKLYGMVTANQYTSLTSPRSPSTREPEVTIRYYDEDSYAAIGSDGYNATILAKVGNTNVSDFLGYKVIAYIREDNLGREKTVIAIMKDDNENESLVINASDIEGIQDDSYRIVLEYWVDKENDYEPERIYIDDDASIIYNGKARYISSSMDIIPTVGEIQLLDIDRDEIYDTIFVKDYTYSVVDFVDHIDKKIYTKDGQVIELDVDKQNEYDFNIMKYGEETDFYYIKEWDVLAVASDKQNLSGRGDDRATLINIEIPNKTIMGTINEMYLNEECFIDFEEYKISPYADLTDMEVGSEGVFYLGLYDEIIALNTIEEPDVTAPIIRLKGSYMNSVPLGKDFIDQGAIAEDDIEKDISDRITVSGEVNTDEIGTYIVRYNVSDSAGNEAEEVSRTVNVIDVTPPVITLLGDSILKVIIGDEYIDEGATAYDDIDGDITENVIVSGLVNMDEVGKYILKYNVNDEAGNPAAEIIRTVYVIKDYYEKQFKTGWNSLSIPLRLDKSTLTEIIEDIEKVEIAYKYNSLNSEWSEIQADTQLMPMDAIFIKLSQETSAKLYPYKELSGPYTKSLNPGWNLVGAALDIGSENHIMNAIDVLNSISNKYSQVISQRLGVQFSWIYVPGMQTTPKMTAGDAYWIYMNEAGILAGFSFTPVDEVYDSTNEELLTMDINTFSEYSEVDSLPVLPTAFYGRILDNGADQISDIMTLQVIVDGVVVAEKEVVNNRFGYGLGDRLIVDAIQLEGGKEISFKLGEQEVYLLQDIDFSTSSGKVYEVNFSPQSDTSGISVGEIIYEVDGQEVTYLEPNNQLKIKTSIENQTFDDCYITMFAVLYGSRGEIVEISKDTKKIPQYDPNDVDNTRDFDVTLDIPHIIDDHKVKVFFWDSILGMRPIIEPEEFPDSSI